MLILLSRRGRDRKADELLQGYKWGNVVIGALAVLGVTMSSSMMSAAIFDIRRAFPGYSSEMYIMSKCHSMGVNLQQAPSRG